MELPETSKRSQFIIIGGGPAGLAAAYELTRHKQTPVVLEKYDKVGGIARTEEYKGFYFDMGGHRFFTKSAEVDQFWREVLGGDFLRRPRLSRIFYKHKFFNYPLKPVNALTKLGLLEGLRIGFSYLRWQVFPYKQENTFEEWVTNRFGRRLFLIFFKSYTEKVWGISTSELSAEWAAQRIKDLDLKAAILSMFVKPKETITTLIEEFDYPRRGPGMMWNQVKSMVEERGGKVQLNSNVTSIFHQNDRLTGIGVVHDGHMEVLEGTDFISSMPITDFVKALQPPPPQAILEAANNLSYRDFLTVCLIVNREKLFDDNWIYIHDPSVKVGRIQNFKNWSPEMVPDARMSSLGMEYFCNQGDELWCMPDKDLVELGKQELERIGLAIYADVIDGCVYRVENSYPVYDSTYRQHLEVIKSYINCFENFQTIGRNGLHRYNNQDHAMLSGMYAVRNSLFNEANNLWNINAEQEYHEEVRQSKDAVAGKVIDKVFASVFTKLDPFAFGTAIGSVSGVILFAVTMWVVLNNLTAIANLLGRLDQYLPGYQVSMFPGGLLGLLYGFLLGFLVGWSIATLRNLSIKIYVSNIRRQVEGNFYRETPSGN